MFDRLQRRKSSHCVVFIHNTCTAVSALVKESVKSAVPHEECRRGAHLPSFGREPVGGYTTEVCDAWPVRCQTYGYLPSRRASPPLDLVLLWPYICAGSEMKPKLF